MTANPRVPRAETITYLTAFALIAVIGCATIKVIEERQAGRVYHDHVVAAKLVVLAELRGRE